MPTNYHHSDVGTFLPTVTRLSDDQERVGAIVNVVVMLNHLGRSGGCLTSVLT